MSCEENLARRAVSPRSCLPHSCWIDLSTSFRKTESVVQGTPGSAARRGRGWQPAPQGASGDLD
eukprot:2214181-Pyramimonas_sp.AAC.1